MPNPPARHAAAPSTGTNGSSNSRFGRGPVRTGYNPPNYGPSNYEKPQDDGNEFDFQFEQEINISFHR